MPADPTQPHALPATGPHSTVPPGDPITLTGDFPAVGPPGFDLREPLGAGGMGVVHRARDLALSRDVAIKLLHDRYPPDSPAARRFRAEAEITAQLQHPGIPPVYHVGRLADGRPFLAMKLIKGETLADLLKGNAERGRLVAAFEGVCQAVGYAHAHGVIHRDLKPANVMVGAFGEVQVMDWGLAKVLADEPAGGDDPLATTPDTEVWSLREEGDRTQDGQAMGTPAYMPPEQAIGAVADIDRRSDVFGLGAVLCHLLTGRPPYLSGDAASTRALAARAKLGDAFAGLDGCGAEPELVALCKRCLAAEKGDRPADAGEVAEAVAGLRRAADDRARRAEVEAGQGLVREAEGRKRRRLLAAAGGAVLAVLLAGVLAAEQQRRRAEAALADVSDQKRATESALADKTAEERAKSAALAAADAARTKTVEALRKLSDDVVVDGLIRKPELTADDRRFLNEVSALWQAVADARGDDADARELRAEGYCRLGDIRRQLGERADAETAYRAALRLFEQLVADMPNHPAVRDGLGIAHTNLGLLLHSAGRWADATAHFETAIRVYSELSRADPAGVSPRAGLASAHLSLGSTHRAAGRPAAAEAAHRAALRVYEQLVADHPAHPKRPDYESSVAAVHGNLGLLLVAASRPADAETAYRSALTVYDRLVAAHPKRALYQEGKVRTHNHLGNLYRSVGRAADAAAEHRAALGGFRRLVADYPVRSDYRTSLGGSYCNLGNLARSDGKLAEALDWYTQAVGTLEPLHAADPRQVTPRLFLRNSHSGRAATLHALDRPVDALAEWDKAIELSPPDDRDRYRKSRASSLAFAGRFEQAVAEAAELADLGGWPADAWYDLACVFSTASVALAGRREECARRAVAALQRAIAAGFRDRAYLVKHTDLDPLRNRPDYKKLLGSLPELAPPPRRVR